MHFVNLHFILISWRSKVDNFDPIHTHKTALADQLPTSLASTRMNLSSLLPRQKVPPYPSILYHHSPLHSRAFSRRHVYIFKNFDRNFYKSRELAFSIYLTLNTWFSFLQICDTIYIVLFDSSVKLKDLSHP